jgi:hypothetical protein
VVDAQCDRNLDRQIRLAERGVGHLGNDLTVPVCPVSEERGELPHDVLVRPTPNWRFNGHPKSAIRLANLEMTRSSGRSCTMSAVVEIDPIEWIPLLDSSARANTRSLQS